MFEYEKGSKDYPRMHSVPLFTVVCVERLLELDLPATKLDKPVKVEKRLYIGECEGLRTCRYHQINSSVCRRLKDLVHRS